MRVQIVTDGLLHLFCGRGDWELTLSEIVIHSRPDIQRQKYKGKMNGSSFNFNKLAFFKYDKRF